MVDIQWHGTNAVTVVYRTDDGRIDEALVYRDHEPELRLAKASMSSAFDADPNDFKLAGRGVADPDGGPRFEVSEVGPSG